MKRLVSIVLVLFIIITIVPMHTFAFGATNKFAYREENGEAIITFVDHFISGEVVVPSTIDGYHVTAIEQHAFSERNNITKVVIPDSVERIDNGVFWKCTSLKSISIGKGVESIGRNVFDDCTSLTEINIDAENQHYSTHEGVLFNKQLTKIVRYPEGKTEQNYTIPYTVVALEEESFSNCKNLKKVVLPNGVTEISASTFHSCTNLETVNIPNRVTSIGGYAFFSCKSIKEITIPYGVKHIGFDAFNNCISLENIVIPDSVTTIQSAAFETCKSLKSVVIGSGVSEIENSTFDSCSSLTSVTIPNNVTKIAEDAFSNCSNLTIRGYSDSYAKSFAKENNIAFVALDGENKCNCKYYNACDTTCNICGEVRTITKHSYYDCFTNDADVVTTWSLTPSASGVYYLGAKHEAKIIDSKGNEIKYLEDAQGYGTQGANIVKVKGGWPLIAGETYTVEIRCEGIPYSSHYFSEKISETIFSDTYAGDWYSDAVTYAVGSGIMSGYASNGKFGTSDSIQRQDFVVMLARLDGVDLENYNYKSKFSDVARNSYYEAAVNWGEKTGIVKGYSHNGKFGVGDPITREQIVTFLYRYAKYKGYDTGYTSDRENTVSTQYTDYKMVSQPEFKQAILWAIEKGAIKGKTDTTIVPQGNAQRCEMAQIMYNIYLRDIFS